MSYWNQDHFEGLEQVARIADEQGLPRLAEYCRLRASGLRKQAFGALKTFIDEQGALPVDRRRAVADRTMTIQSDHPGAGVLSHPLWNQFLEPVLEEWRNESPSTIPRRWLGIYTGNPDIMRDVLDRDPTDVRVRAALVGRLLNFVEYATHHLSEGLFIGQVEDDRKH